MSKHYGIQRISDDDTRLTEGVKLYLAPPIPAGMEKAAWYNGYTEREEEIRKEQVGMQLMPLEPSSKVLDEIGGTYDEARAKYKAMLNAVKGE